MSSRKPCVRTVLDDPDKVVYIAGPLYPDLFGADTPIMEPVAVPPGLRVWSVEGYIVRSQPASVRIIGRSKREAQRVGKETAKKSCKPGEEFVVKGCIEVGPASANEASVYLKERRANK